MRRRRIGRFVVEVLFLAGVAAIATVAELRPAGVVVLIAIAWVVVALFEWTAWLDEPHYGRGLPPRFYVPQVALPPRRPVEQPRYLGVREDDDAPTFAVSELEWATALGEWPVLDSSPVGEETEIAIFDELLPAFAPELELDEEPLPEFPPEIAFPLPVPPAAEVTQQAPEEAPARGPAQAPEEEDEETGENVEAGLEQEQAAAAGAELEARAEAAEVGASEGVPPLAESVSGARAEPVELREPTRTPPLQEAAAPEAYELPDIAAAGIARHRVDPLSPARRRGLLRRSADDERGIVELRDRPPEGRDLPSPPGNEGAAAGR